MSSGREKPTVLIVDDERNFAESLQLAIEDRYATSIANDLAAARRALAECMPDALLLDVRLPDGEGTELLRDLKRIGSLPVVCMMTAHATLESAITALKEGAAEYFTKPLDIDRLKRELGIYLENRVLHTKLDALRNELRTVSPPFITAGAGAMRMIVEKAPMIAALPIPVLIRGETGTGKEKLAQWIHQLSNLRGELVALSCATLPKDIFESELFGYVKGAFSGASASKEGLIERAEGGTLFLDEIGELPDDTQAKLLRVLENGVYFKLGETRERTARFRLITATNRNLLDPSSTFRRDLFYRINGMVLELPRLADRKEDIALLVDAFLREANHAYNKDVRGLTSQAMDAVMRHSWPGNIRELKWCIHRAVATAGGDQLDVHDILPGAELSAPSCRTDENRGAPRSLGEAVAELERSYIAKALADARDNKTEAARLLDISVRQLHYKIKQYGL